MAHLTKDKQKAADLTTAIQQCCRKCPVDLSEVLKTHFSTFSVVSGILYAQQGREHTVSISQLWLNMSEVLCFPKHQHRYARCSSRILMMPSVADCYYILVHLKKCPDVQPCVYNTHQDNRCNNWVLWENVDVDIGILTFQTCYNPVVLVWKWPNLHSLLDALGGSRIIFGVQVSQEQRVDERRLPKPWFA